MKQHAFSGLSVRSFSSTSVIHIQSFPCRLSLIFQECVCQTWWSLFLFQHHIAAIVRLIFPLFFSWSWSVSTCGGGEGGRKDWSGWINGSVEGITSFWEKRHYWSLFHGFRTASTHRTFASHCFSWGSTGSSFAEENSSYFKVLTSQLCTYVAYIYFFEKQRL